MAQHSIDWFLEELEGVEGASGQYTAWCPAHDDIGTSVKGLSITENTRGTILIRCHSCGAGIQEVIRALEGEDPYRLMDTDFKVNINKVSKNGNAPEDTVPTTTGAGMAWWVKRTQVPEEVWDSLGCVEHQNGVAFTFAGMEIAKVRRPPKEFNWMGSGERPPLWPAPEDELPKEVAITEGESDCGTLRAAGFHAFSITAGAGKGDKRYLTESHFEALMKRGVESVILAGDMDSSGAQFMSSGADLAAGVGLKVRVIRLDIVLDPFSGINDLNGMWKACIEVGEDFNALLERAIQDISARIPFLTLSEVLEVAKEEIDYLIPGLIAPSDKVLVSGPQKSYKTWLTLDMLRSLVTGSRFLSREEFEPTRTVSTMFVQEEGSRQLWAQRIAKLQLPKDASCIWAHRQGVRFTEPESIASLIDTMRREGVQVLFLDPMQRMIPGINENDSSETGIVWDEVMRMQLAIPGLVVVILHHANKSERLSWESIRGSSRHAGEVDLGIFLEKHPIENNTVRVAVDGRDIPQYLGTGESFEVKVTLEDDLFIMDGKEIKVNVVNTGQVVGRKNRDIVMLAVSDGCDTRSKIMRETRLSDSTVREHLSVLMSEDLVDEIDNGVGVAKTYIPKGTND